MLENNTAERLNEQNQSLAITDSVRDFITAKWKRFRSCVMKHMPSHLNPPPTHHHRHIVLPTHPSFHTVPEIKPTLYDGFYMYTHSTVNA